jgi:hypothetical protein
LRVRIKDGALDTELSPFDHSFLSACGISGLGQQGSPDAGTIAAMAAQGAATTGVILSALASPTLAVLAPEFAIAGPIGAAVAAGVEVGLLIANIFSGCGQTCVLASDAANQVGAALVKNNDAYWGAPTHYYSMQQATLNNVLTGIKALQAYCGQPQLGDAGKRCISERLVRGGTAPWCPTSTGCDYWSVFYDPVAADPNVVPDPVIDSATGTVQGVEGSSGAGSGGSVQSASGAPAQSSLPTPLLIGAALFAVLFMMVRS